MPWGPYSHLDAAALTQPGGFMDAAAQTVARALQSGFAVRDRADERAHQAALAAIADTKDQERVGYARDLEAAKLGSYQGQDPTLLNINAMARENQAAVQTDRRSRWDREVGQDAEAYGYVPAGLEQDPRLQAILAERDRKLKAQKPTPLDKPIVQNLGTDSEPNWRQWNPATNRWMPVQLDDPAPALPEGAAPAAPAAPAPDGGSGWGTMRRSGIPGATGLGEGETLGDVLSGRWLGNVLGVREREGAPAPAPSASAAPVAPAAPAGPSASAAAPAQFQRDAKGLLRIPTTAGGTLGVTDQEWQILQSDTPERAAMIRQWSATIPPERMAIIKATLKAQGIR